uniref:Uncharacterized protein n=1 Tax=Caenorhabditis japonica TaxID=281687 RepID=A0A8R1IG47_CAEJA
MVTTLICFDPDTRFCGWKYTSPWFTLEKPSRQIATTTPVLTPISSSLRRRKSTTARTSTTSGIQSQSTFPSASAAATRYSDLRSHHLGNLNGARQKSYDHDNEKVHQHHQRHQLQSRCQRVVEKATFPSVNKDAPFHFERIRVDPEENGGGGFSTVQPVPTSGGFVVIPEITSAKGRIRKN